MEIKLIYLIALKIEIICTKHEDSCTVIIYSMSVTVVIVTEQTRLQPRGTLTHGPTISAEENRFLLTGFQPWGGAGAETPFLPRESAVPLLPKRLQAKTMPRSSPFPYLFLIQPCKQIPILSGMCTCGFQSRHPLTAALSFGVWGVLFSASMQWFRKTCAVLHWVMVESREAHVPRE